MVARGLAAQHAAVELDIELARSYLITRNLADQSDDVSCEELGGGISNRVIRCHWQGGCVVIKQSLPELRVDEEWRFDRRRIAGEERCLRYLSTFLDAGTVPEVVDSDLDNFIFTMSCASPGGVVWKHALLNGQIEGSTAQRAGSLLGTIHSHAADDSEAREAFSDQSVLVQGRISPYHMTTALKHPDLARHLKADAHRLLHNRRTLVLGDYCPKNTIVYPDFLMILDFEVAHWGDPAFDVAFCLTHLVLKACRFRHLCSSFLLAAQSFWNSYEGATGDRFPGVEVDALSELGCLLLARIDGKSKVEYITDDRTKDLVRDVGRELLLGTCSSVDEAVELVLQHIYGGGGWDA